MAAEHRMISGRFCLAIIFTVGYCYMQYRTMEAHMNIRHAMIIPLCALAGLIMTLAVSAENCESSQVFGNLEVKLYMSKWDGCKLSADGQPGVDLVSSSH